MCSFPVGLQLQSLVPERNIESDWTIAPLKWLGLNLILCGLQRHAPE